MASLTLLYKKPAAIYVQYFQGKDNKDFYFRQSAMHDNSVHCPLEKLNRL